jgi:glycosyltransferase involved in cell wall biosynthesis
MKLRLAWLADPEDWDTYSARETRVLLRALARTEEVVPLWFAPGSAEPPHYWNGIRVFPIPAEACDTADFLATLISQQRPHAIFSNQSCSAYPAALEFLRRSEVRWIHRLNPADVRSEWTPQAGGLLVENGKQGSTFANESALPFLRGFDDGLPNDGDPTTVLQQLKDLVLNGHITFADEVIPRRDTHLVMRQQLFSNTSLAHVMFELTNALIELGIPTVPQAEHTFFSKGFIHQEEDRYRLGAPDKYERVRQHLHEVYDPENSITVHFCLFKSGMRYAHHAVFPSLAGREILYTTGNHTVTPEQVRRLLDSFNLIVAPAEHVLRPYVQAGLPRRWGAVVPHGIDPMVFSPHAPPFRYATRRGFKFLQTSFPWIYEKGFDLTVKAFCRAFSDRDDVALILRTPKIQEPHARDATFGRLVRLLSEEVGKPGSPEVVLLEQDIEASRRGGIYTGADCYVHPLRAEGFGMTILEAMACGLPVIATAWSGPSDFLSPTCAYTLCHSNPVPEQDQNGRVRRYHVEPDLDHLIHLMRYVYHHQDEAKALGGRASLVARQGWTWKRAATALASLCHLT